MSHRLYPQVVRFPGAVEPVQEYQKHQRQRSKCTVALTFEPRKFCDFVEIFKMVQKFKTSHIESYIAEYIGECDAADVDAAILLLSGKYHVGPRVAGHIPHRINTHRDLVDVLSHPPDKCIFGICECLDNAERVCIAALLNRRVNIFASREKIIGSLALNNLHAVADDEEYWAFVRLPLYQLHCSSTGVVRTAPSGDSINVAPRRGMQPRIMGQPVEVVVNVYALDGKYWAFDIVAVNGKCNTPRDALNHITSDDYQLAPVFRGNARDAVSHFGTTNIILLSDAKILYCYNSQPEYFG